MTMTWTWQGPLPVPQLSWISPALGNESSELLDHSRITEQNLGAGHQGGAVVSQLPQGWNNSEHQNPSILLAQPSAPQFPPKPGPMAARLQKFCGIKVSLM